MQGHREGGNRSSAHAYSLIVPSPWGTLAQSLVWRDRHPIPECDTRPGEPAMGACAQRMPLTLPPAATC